MNIVKNFVCLGAGNLAHGLCTNLTQAGFKLIKVYSKSDSAAELAEKYHARSSDKPDSLPDNIGFIIMAVSDDSIPSVINDFSGVEVPVFHTAGSVSMNVFKGRIKRYGVIYPIQTFSKQKDISLRKVPVLVEACETSTLELAKSIAGKLSETVIEADSEKRCNVHIAAVFACNFMNHMQTMAGDILQKNDLPKDLLRPLVEETCQKILTLIPVDAQTGPAKRGDVKVLEKHSSMLQDWPEYKQVYDMLSEQIRKKYNR